MFLKSPKLLFGNNFLLLTSSCALCLMPIKCERVKVIALDSSDHKTSLFERILLFLSSDQRVVTLSECFRRRNPIS